MELTERQKQFLLAALDAAWKGSRVFNSRAVGAWIKYGMDEADEIARALEKQNLLRRLPNGEAVLTGTGREQAEMLKGGGS